MELEQHEKDLLLGYLEKRLSQYPSEKALDKTYQEKTKLLIQKLNGRLPHFTPLEKSFLIGCLQEYFFDDNEDLYLISDFDLLFRDSLLERRIEQIDTHLILRNKLMKKSEKKKKLFCDKLGELDKLLSAKRVYYSALDNGNVYKAGIQVEGRQCAGFSPDSLSHIRKIEIGNVSSKDYETSASPSDVLALMEEYSTENTPKPGHSDFMNLLEFIIEKNQ